MARYKITGPDGASYEVSAPDNASHEDVLAYAQKNFGQAEAPKASEAGIPWSDVPRQALSNLPSSAANVAKSLGHAIAHPIDTVSTMADVAAGGLRAGAQKVLPKAVFDAIDTSTGSPETTQRIETAANAAGKHLADRYGSVEGFKKALATDPVGVVADASAALTGAGGIATRAPGIVGRAGQAVQRAASAVDPISATARVALPAAGRLSADLVGVMTGAGTRPIQEAYRAGTTGNRAFVEHMRELRPLDEVVDMANRAVGRMGAERSREYNAGMAGVRANQTPMDFQPVLNALAGARNRAVYTSPTGRAIVKDAEALAAHDQIERLIGDFMHLPPVERTPSAFDALKQSIGDIRQAHKQGTAARDVANEAYRAARDEITRQVPGYADTMRDYGHASDAIGEMRRTLSVNDKASTDTTLRKLQSTMRNNVNTNYGQRTRLLDELAQYEPNLPAALAGQALNANMPRGLARIGVENAVRAGAAFMHPGTLATLPLQSPRLMGETAYGLGRVVGGARDINARFGSASVTPGAARGAAQAGYAAGMASRGVTAPNPSDPLSAFPNAAANRRDQETPAERYAREMLERARQARFASPDLMPYPVTGLLGGTR